MTTATNLSAANEKPMLDADVALERRRAIYGTKLQVTAAEADALFALNTAAGEVSAEWQALFVEVMVDFVVLQQNPVGYVDDAKAEWLIASVSRDGPLREDELEMLIRVLEDAQSTPAKLSAFVLERVKASVLRGLDRSGRLERDAIEHLRRVLFAAGGDGNIAVTGREAETLFDVNDALKGKSADPAWSEFFAHAVGSAVLLRPTWAPDANQEIHRQAWLSDTQHHALGLLGSFADLEADKKAVEEGFREIIHWNFVDEDPDKLASRQDGIERDVETITPDEAHWLLGRIGRDGRFDAGEQALISFLRANATAVDPSLSGLLMQPSRTGTGP